MIKFYDSCFYRVYDLIGRTGDRGSTLNASSFAISLVEFLYAMIIWDRTMNVDIPYWVLFMILFGMTYGHRLYFLSRIEDIKMRFKNESKLRSLIGRVLVVLAYTGSFIITIIGW